jgi:hypothetical protein
MICTGIKNQRLTLASAISSLERGRWGAGGLSTSGSLLVVLGSSGPFKEYCKNMMNPANYTMYKTLYY